MTACGDTAGYPRGWPQLKLAATSDAHATTCPGVMGQYHNDSERMSRTLFAKDRSSDDMDREWQTITISGNTDSALYVVLQRSNTEPDSIALNRGRSFDCVDGWLKIDWSTNTALYDSADYASARTTEHAIWLRKDVLGHLVGRIVRSSYVSFNVWCGDGCKSVTIPFTGRSSARWERLTATLAVDPAEAARARASIKTPENSGTSAVALASPIGTKLSALLPAGGYLLAITPDNGGYRATLNFRDTDAEFSFTEALMSSNEFREPRTIPIEVNRTVEGRLLRVVWFAAN